MMSPDWRDNMEYSFCETLAANLWHIRQLTDAGQKRGGGADTPTLCGLTAAWDVSAPIPPKLLGGSGICHTCAAKYKKVWAW